MSMNTLLSVHVCVGACMVQQATESHLQVIKNLYVRVSLTLIIVKCMFPFD